jgi:hypothetical protein
VRNNIMFECDTKGPFGRASAVAKTAAAVAVAK